MSNNSNSESDEEFQAAAKIFLFAINNGNAMTHEENRNFLCKIIDHGNEVLKSRLRLINARDSGSSARESVKRQKETIYVRIKSIFGPKLNFKGKAIKFSGNIKRVDSKSKLSNGFRETFHALESLDTEKLGCMLEYLKALKSNQDTMAAILNLTTL